MKPTFIHTLINPPFEDPCLFVRIIREKRALLFDIGNINRLHPKDLQKITDVFVTHTHIDHFIGFDSLLRALLRRKTPLRVYGPDSIIDCIEGKLKGYSWNLVREYPFKIFVFSVKNNKVYESNFFAEDCFKRKDKGDKEFDGILLKEPLFVVRAVELDHQIPCLGFSIEEEYHININKVILKEMSLPVGQWLSELKKMIRENKPDDYEFIVNGKRLSLGELRKLATITKGQKISYITDVSISEENINKIINFVKNSDTLYCEAYFMDKDEKRAIERYHLTSKIAGSIAKEAFVKQLVVMHFSPIYRDKTETPKDEALNVFKNSDSLQL
jgi:ribonuclease Z